MSSPVAVMWFRRDLRLADNPALVAAARAGTVVALFVHDPALVDRAGANRVAYLHATLDVLDRSVDGHLVERVGDPAVVVPAVAAEVGATEVHAAEDFGPYGSSRDRAVGDALEGRGARLVLSGSPYAVPPDTVFTKTGGNYRVFTPFSKAWRAHGWDDPVAAPAPVPWVSDMASDPRPPTPRPEASAGLPPAGEPAASQAAEDFLATAAATYDEDRNRPDLDRTSRLSPHLKLGTIHPRQLLARLGTDRGEQVFASELCWREFYADVLHHRPDSVRRNLNEGMDGLAWDTGPEADERFDRWCAGLTGYPMVDAGMRQLSAEGWMHNRVRMIAASFLVKDLHIDWRRGAAWFMRHLVDGDLASNTHGWQWTAGTGTDAAPFFRVFNPVAQGRRFDPDGSYVRRYVPELADVAGADVHEPRTASGDLFEQVTGYPAPIVDHAVERREALARYEHR